MRKVIVLGLDGGVPYQFHERALCGELPNIKRLIDNGFFAPALPLPSGVTPVNWLSVVTGAYPGTHGVSEFCVHLPGTPLTEWREAFHSDICQADFIWDALAHAGLKAATISFPGSRPRTCNELIAIGDVGIPGDGSSPYEIASAQSIATPDAIPPTENTPLLPKYQPATVKWDGNSFEFSIHPSGPKLKAMIGDSTALRIIDVNGNQLLCEVKPGKWTSWLSARFEVSGEKVTATFRFYPTCLDIAHRRLALYVSPIYYASGFSEPAEYANALVGECGPYFETLSVSKCSIGWYPPEAFLDECQWQLMWQAKAALKLTRSMDAAVVFAKWHAFDKFYHTFFHKIDPISPHHQPSEREQWEGYHTRLHEIVDEAVGLILDEMDDETILIIVSDHGLVPARKHLWVNNFLAHHGFISVSFSEDGTPNIDWSRTRAFCAPFTQIWINLKGREPHGIVEPGEEYEALRDAIIEKMRAWQDPETGQHVIDEVFRREDGAFYGLWNERDGDIRFFTQPGYSVFRTTRLTARQELITVASGYYKGDHGSSRPSKRFGLGAETALFGIYGSGVRKVGYHQKPIKLTDITPTICALLGVDPPAQCEGAVIRDCIEL